MTSLARLRSKSTVFLRFAVCLSQLCFAATTSHAHENNFIPPPGRTVAVQFLNLPAGRSVWQQELRPAQQLGGLVVAWEITPRCQGFDVWLELQDAQTGYWYPTRRENRIFYHQVPLVSAVRYSFDQRALPQASCRVLLNTIGQQPPPPSPTPTPTPTRRTLAGVINYTGGFVENASLELNPPLDSDHLEVVIPNYCRDIQITDARVLTQDRWIQGRLSTHAPYELQFDRFLLIKSIALSVLGPQGQNCQIPVYARVRQPIVHNLQDTQDPDDE